VEVEDRRQAPEPVEAPMPTPVPQSATPAWLVPGAGLALIAGGLLWLAAVVGIAAEGYVTEQLRNWLIVAGLLLLAGLGGFLVRHGRAMGRAGRSGLLLTGFGIVLFIGSAIALADVYIGETSLPWSSSLVLVALPALLFLLGVGGLLARSGGTSLLARGAGALTVGGLALLLVGVELNDRYLDLPLYESGRFVFIVGLALLAVALLRTGALPRWSGFTLLGFVIMSTLLTTLPLATGITALGDGLAWIVLGVLLWWSARAKAPAAAAARPHPPVDVPVRPEGADRV